MSAANAVGLNGEQRLDLGNLGASDFLMQYRTLH